MADSLVCVGQIAGSFGVRGDVRLKSFCAQPEAIAAYAPLVTDDGRTFDVTLNGAIKNGFSARLSGVAKKEEGDALKGVRLYAPRERLPDPDDDEFYHADLIGLDVVDTGGTIVGKVKAVIEQGAGDLLEIAANGQTEPVLLPFTQAFVPTVDLAGGRLVIDPPEGIFS
ncbi:Ribosome maturation factor RimM [Rhodobacteraceae bacterium THAF1]|uniref:ribosome maturation factor RimM n=1 Tax=Palleronia sp. THAF1 TaxID=2587842 RepID=UPI000F410C52|nr:ribosome maturation factor RimM [Palleronia sp. THAF1]QFU07808.1 Ribosome maturation factor RimM [Palleronia sp. THAF1]VDC25623.1 Ribosome maturation factor RimM [Rhodobacteraceae bacterium THAF1]